MAVILSEKFIDLVTMTELAELPVHTAALLFLVISLGFALVGKTVFNFVGYVWAVLSMPRQERISFLSRSGFSRLIDRLKNNT